jgi:glucose/arabinose dehydrogenase
MTRRPHLRGALLAGLLAIVAALAAAPGAGAATTLPAGFEDQTVFEGINQPTLIRFAPNGEVFIGEKNGKILVFESLEDKTPETFADLSKPVYDFEDHGLLGMAIDPQFNFGRPYVYALYTFNHKLANKYTQEPQVSDPKSVTPAWPSASPNFENDKCVESEKAKKGEIPKEALGCEVSGVLVRLTAEGAHAKPTPGAPDEEVLLEGWCQQATTHSIGDLGFGPEGDLYVSGGEGAMYSQPDYGQFGNVCEDPPEPLNPNPTRLSALGGSLRSQSLLRKHETAAEATLLSGTVLRINPDTGEGVPGNPKYATSGEQNAKRIVAFGFRQPWRFTFNNRTGNLFVDNVGNGAFEEMDRFPYGSSATAYNGGWPCYEGGPNGPARNYEYAGEYEENGEIIPDPSIQVCIDQYKAEDEGKAQTSAPFYAYPNGGPAVPGDPCPKKPTDISGNAFYEGAEYPKAYRNALFFADSIRGCIYLMRSAANGEPDPATATTFLRNSEPFSFPGVDVEQGPEGNIFYTQLKGAGGGTIHRIVWTLGPETGPTPPPTSPPVTPQPPLTPAQPKPSPPKINKRPAKSTESTSAKFAFSGQPGMRFRCKVDGKGFSSCHSPRLYKHLKSGRHQFRVYALNASGERGTATIFKWKIVKRS